MLKPVQNRRYWFVLVVQAFLFFVAPFTRDSSVPAPAFHLRPVRSLRHRHPHHLESPAAETARHWRAAAVALATGVMAFPDMRFEEPVIPYLMACCVAYAFFILIAIVSIGADVLFRESVTLDCIWGSISVYMFLGMFFAFLFGFLAFLVPEAFDYALRGGDLGETQAQRSFVLQLFDADDHRVRRHHPRAPLCQDAGHI